MVSGKKPAELAIILNYDKPVNKTRVLAFCSGLDITGIKDVETVPGNQISATGSALRHKNRISSPDD